MIFVQICQEKIEKNINFLYKNFISRKGGYYDTRKI